MKAALDETSRRRAKQVAYNEAHGITPETVKKSIHVIERAHKPAVEVALPKVKSLDDLRKQKAKLEKAMLDAASNLEFEQAAKLRDELHTLETLELNWLGE
jgi:excinuclease ABC subunit B